MASEKYLEKLLEDFKNGKIDKDRILQELKRLPYQDLNFAKLDHHRKLRRGQGEVVFCQGKDLSHLLPILTEFKNRGEKVLATRMKKEVYEEIKDSLADASYYPVSGILIMGKFPEPVYNSLILVITAGTSDISVAEEALLTSRFYGHKSEYLYDVGIAGVHRLLDHIELLDSASVIIAVAGMEGALPALVGGLVSCPVIAVPTSVGYGASFKGLAPLLTMLNSCVPGLSVVNIDNGFGAGYLASLIAEKNK
ncbi:MAG: nickel pincer cofactor biosynthesis protein LarB [Candidatus Coatesbacteria bacterium]|nr:nickel pincer cofactor biosynthesis protein LarB [Candidatus Coatesbacteria bacterium]